MRIYLELKTKEGWKLLLKFVRVSVLDTLNITRFEFSSVQWQLDQRSRQDIQTVCGCWIHLELSNRKDKTDSRHLSFYFWKVILMCSRKKGQYEFHRGCQWLWQNRLWYMVPIVRKNLMKFWYVILIPILVVVGRVSWGNMASLTLRW